MGRRDTTRAGRNLDGDVGLGRLLNVESTHGRENVSGLFQMNKKSSIWGNRDGAVETHWRTKSAEPSIGANQLLLKNVIKQFEDGCTLASVLATGCPGCPGHPGGAP